MDKHKKATGGYGEGYTDGWLSAAGGGPVPPHIGVVPLYAVPVDMTAYEYGYSKGREGALTAKKNPSNP